MSRAFQRGVSLAALCVCTLSACAGAGNYIWFKDLPKTDWQTPSGGYVIGIGDVVNIRVYEQEGLSGSVKVRSDGYIALPLVGEVMVAGRPPLQLGQELEKRFKEFVVSPRVTVNVETSQPIEVSAIGEIGNTGVVKLEGPSHLIQALSEAGGPKEFADKSSIYVLRQFPKFQRIRFTYDAILRNENGAATFPLRTGDVIVVE